MGALTPALLLPAPRQVSLITERAFPDIPSPTTPCAPVFRRYFLFRAGLAPDSLCLAIGGSSDFAQWSQSHQSHQAVSSLCRGRMTRPSVLRTIFSFPVALHIPSAVCSYFQLVAGSSATEGLSPSHARSLSSARPRPVPGRSGVITLTARIFSKRAAPPNVLRPEDRARSSFLNRPGAPSTRQGCGRRSEHPADSLAKTSGLAALSCRSTARETPHLPLARRLPHRQRT